MSGLFGIMATGTRGLNASQLALNVTSQNISNANTEGYSRKRLNLTSEFRRDPQFGQMGFGVEVTNISRIRDFFIDQQINRQTQEVNYFKEMDDTATRIEDIFGEPADTSLSKVMDTFWNSWSDLANNPESIAARDVVKANAKVLIDTMHSLSKEIRNLREAKNQDVETTVGQVNQLVKQIYELNKEISVVEVSGHGKANDSRDQRDLAIQKLSELINITTQDAGNGMTSILTNGNMLVGPASYVALETSTVTGTRPDGTSYSSIGVRYSSTKKDYMPQSGKLRGIIDSRDELVPYFETKLDDVANAVVNEVNSLHHNGYTLNGVTGVDFFKVNSHEDNVEKHREVVDGKLFAFNPFALPLTHDLGNVDIVGGTFKLTDPTGATTYVEGTDYSLNYSTGQITILPSATMTGLPFPPAPNVVASYEYNVPRGTETAFRTYASNIELSAAIEQNVINIAASSGGTTQAFSDTLNFAATGVYQYVQHTPGPDGVYGTADDDPDGNPVSGDELRERSAIKEGSFTLKSGATTLRENQDYFVDYANGKVILLNNAYIGTPLQVEYEASVPGSNGFTDNGNATAIAELRHTNLMDPDYAGNATSSIGTYYNSFVSELGVQKNEFTSNNESRQFLLEQFQARQAEVSGVSLDEELANLVKYQHTYQASARVISTVDKMLEVLFSM